MRRQTVHLKIFERQGPEAVIYDLSDADCVTITLPAASRWTSQLHWHETHTEFLQVLQGRAFVRLGDRAGIHGPEDGVIEVPKYTVHEWHRAADGDRSDLIVREWTMPGDGQKEVFFRNLNSFLTEPQPSSLYDKPSVIPTWGARWLESWIIPLQLCCIFRSWDNWPVLIGDDSRLVIWPATHLVLGFCSSVGFVLGLRGTYDEYVDKALLLRAGTGSGGKKTR
ncbi:hypothetical protein CLCR_07594 [Cladophialophora carrionii]|uniref:Cupin 2 conserved barrel domain-containing protein n=1 Tax=Cladophialophora carrionii TaxID=86049 RepID=A0A1C1CMQ5_9EURO|nr:hypothetical protein CLCR_07594 [Cladophialophora carrionii]